MLSIGRTAHSSQFNISVNFLNPHPVSYLRDNGETQVIMAGIQSFYDITAKTLTGEELKFSSLQGKVVLIENVASL